MDIKECKFNKNGTVELFDMNANVVFTFELERQKSTESNKELLKITAKQENIALGEGTVRPYSMIEDLLNFKQYGVVLPRKVYSDICREIEGNYLSLQPVFLGMSGELTKENIHDIFSMFCDYIKDFDIKAQENKKGIKTYSLPVADFLGHLKDSDYRDLDSTKIRDGLRDNGYTVCNTGRNDNTIIDKDTSKAVKVISFKTDRADGRK